MNATELLFPDGRSTGLWQCGKCHYTCREESAAQTCCLPIPCKYCGLPTGQIANGFARSGYHSHCWEANLIDKAEKLEAWDGWVYSSSGGGNNGYFESLDEYVDHLACEDIKAEDWPEWVFVCDEKPFPKVYLDHILSNLAEEMYEDAADHFEGEKELEEAINAFNAANAHLTSYDWNMKKVVRVPREEP